MKRFTVKRKYVEISIIDVDAETEEDALELAESLTEDFEYINGEDEFFVTDVEEVEPEVKEKKYTGFGC